jgi:hypothetical protein
MRRLLVGVLLLASCGGDPGAYLVPQTYATWNNDADFIAALGKLPADQKEAALYYGELSSRGVVSIKPGMTLGDVAAAGAKWKTEHQKGPQCTAALDLYARLCALPSHDLTAALCGAQEATKKEIEGKIEGQDSAKVEEECAALLKNVKETAYMMSYADELKLE